MRRMFDEHQLRRVIPLDGLWSFALDPDGRGEQKEWFVKFPADAVRMAVPGCWNTFPEWCNYQGRGWYQRTLQMPDARKHLVLTFEGTGGALSVWLDGKFLGRNPVSCLPWRVSVNNLSAGIHTLVVEVNNSKPLEDVFPRYGNDWAHYGGIVRSVEAAFLDDIWIQELRLPYTLSSAGVTLAPEITIANMRSVARTEDLFLEINGKAVAQWQVRIPAGGTVCSRHPLPARKLALWSPDKPVLHTVRVMCGGDDLADRTGFRSLTCHNSKLKLNGKSLQIRGVNRHHEYGDNGFAMPSDMVLRDFELIRDLGCNAVRCHYPIDSFAMDLCDEMGLLVWSEIPFYARWEAVVGEEAYLKLAETAMERMVRRDYNRPAVFVWSVQNECATDTPDGVRAAKRLIRRTRHHDSTRPVSYATNRLTKDKALGQLDLIGINAYPGWYDDKEKPDHWTPIIDDMVKKLNRQSRGMRPLIVTETGGGAIYGDRTLEDRKWSERYQADLLEKNIGDLLNDSRVAGLFIWQFADARTITEYWNQRPGVFNNKGLLDRFRRPKASYWRVRDLYRKYAKRRDSSRRRVKRS